jgi:hypothetical protein
MPRRETEKSAEDLPDTLEIIMGDDLSTEYGSSYRTVPLPPFTRSPPPSSIMYDSMDNHLQSLKRQSAMIYASCLHIESLLRENIACHTTKSAQETDVQTNRDATDT